MDSVDVPPARPSAMERHREAMRALEQQRRHTLATAIALLVTLGIWSAALALHDRFGEALHAHHPRLLASLLLAALLGAFPAGMLVRWWMIPRAPAT